MTGSSGWLGSAAGVGVFLLALGWLAIAGGAQAQTQPQLIPFEAFLTNGAGDPLSGRYAARFRIYDNEANDGALLWEERRDDVRVHAGRLAVVLGEVAPLRQADGAPIDFGTKKLLGITVVDDSRLEGQEMVPRHELFPSYYAWQAERADDADRLGGTPADAYATVAEQDHERDLLLDQIELRRGQADDIARALGEAPPLSDAAKFEAAKFGACNGRVVTVSDDEVLLQPYDSPTLVVELDGKLLVQNGPVSFRWDDLDAGDEDFAKFYFLYVEDGGGVPSPIISAAAPSGARHPTRAARYVGEFYNDDSGDIVPMDHNPKTGEYRLLRLPWDLIHLGTALDPTYDVYSGLGSQLPPTAYAALIQTILEGDDVLFYFAHRSMSGTNIAGNEHGDFDYTTWPASGVRLEMTTGGTVEASTGEVSWIPLDPGIGHIAKASVNRGSSHSVEDAWIAVMGWRSLR